jgi:hypothetical protein
MENVMMKEEWMDKDGAGRAELATYRVVTWSIATR